MKPLKFGEVMTKKEAADYMNESDKADKFNESLAKKRKVRIDDIMYNREIEAIHELYG